MSSLYLVLHARVQTFDVIGVKEKHEQPNKA